MPLSHLIALIINVHPYELNGLSCIFTQEKRILIQKRPDFYGMYPAFGSVRPWPTMINCSIKAKGSLRLVNDEGLGKSPNIYDVNRSGCMIKSYSKLVVS